MIKNTTSKIIEASVMRRMDAVLMMHFSVNFNMRPTKVKNN